MGRWEPDARGRLVQSALELYAEKGFDETTAIEVAERAGVTERTFFRHFADKREVLFQASRDLQDGVVAAIAAAPADLPVVEVGVRAMVSVASVLEDNRPHSVRRALVIASNASLQERELLKLSSLGAAVSTALRERGTPQLVADLAAETAVTSFKIGFDLWISDDKPGTFAECIALAFDQLKALTAGH